MSFLFLTDFLLTAAFLSLCGRGLGGVNLPTGATEEDSPGGGVGKLLLAHCALGDGDTAPGSHLTAGN